MQGYDETDHSFLEYRREVHQFKGHDFKQKGAKETHKLRQFFAVLGQSYEPVAKEQVYCRKERAPCCFLIKCFLYFRHRESVNHHFSIQDPIVDAKSGLLSFLVTMIIVNLHADGAHVIISASSMSLGPLHTISLCFGAIFLRDLYIRSLSFCSK